MFKSSSSAQTDGSDSVAYRDEATLCVVEAQLACLFNRQAMAGDHAAWLDISHQIRDAMAARRSLLRALSAERAA
jgi:hypothetical protein